MKRPRSYGEDLDEDAGERGTFKEWARRDGDPERPSAHRRFYSKTEGWRKGSSSSSYDRAPDDDRDAPRVSRKRFDHEADGFERRSRYRDGGLQLSSSPRGSYGGGGERLHRSESFSVPRREFPKGFRSERDRPRRDRDGSGSSSSWRRLSNWKEGADGELRLPAAEPVGKRDHTVSEDRVSAKSKDSPSGEQSRSIGTGKAEEAHRESCSSSEMEEGELQPDPEPDASSEPSTGPSALMKLDAEDCRDRGSECNIVSEERSEKEVDLQLDKKNAGLDKEDACEAKEEVKSLDMTVEQVIGRACAPHHQENSTKESSEHGSDGEGDGNIDGVGSAVCEEKQTAAEAKLVAAEEGKGAEAQVSSSRKEKSKIKEEVSQDIEVEAGRKGEVGTGLEVDVKEAKGIDLEVAPEGTINSFDTMKDVAVEHYRNDVTLELMSDRLKENHKDKGKSIVVTSLSSTADSMEEEDPIEGPTGRGFELVFHSDAKKMEQTNHGGIVIGKQKDEKRRLEPLDLSLGLPNISLDHTSRPPNTYPNSPSHARSIQSLPSSFRTNSDAFTTSISFSGSQPFTHNPSCSLNQNSLENYEQSVGSRPIFQGVDQLANGTVWQGQSLNEPKWKGGAGLLFQRALLNANGVHHSPHSLNGHHHSVTNGLAQQSSLPRQLSPTHSLGSRDTRSENAKGTRLLTRERSSSSRYRSEQQDGVQLVLNGVGVVDRILSKIVSDPLQAVGRMLQDMTDQSLAYLKETISEMIVSTEKHGQLQALQEALQRRPDLTMETLPRCHRTLLEILVALRTGLPDILHRANDVSSSYLAEIFLNLRCRNLGCLSILPVDECDCKVCIQRNGFCSACMCLVCSKFDMASNTCSWVGCDVCQHWCHTDCGLKNSHIRNGRSASEAQGMTEMQFHCIACDHPSEMFGFVKEVFQTFAKDWKVGTLAKELQYVRRIFSACNDARGINLRDVADQMLVKLEDKANLSEVINYIMAVFAESDSNINSSPTLPLREPSRSNAEESKGIASSSKEAPWLPSASSDKVPKLASTGFLSSGDCDQIGGQTRDVESQISLKKKLVVDELESVVRFKQVEAKMYQERSDVAKREADGLKRIALAKNVKIEEDYASRIAKLRLAEAEERRRQKLQELQVLERANQEYLSMKTRMEADFKDLLFRLEATKHNFNS